VVAAFTHFPTSYQRAKVIKFSNEGNAAITQNCPLAVSGFQYFISVPFDSNFQISEFSFVNMPHFFKIGWRVGKAKYGVAIFGEGLIYDVSAANMINQTWQTNFSPTTPLQN
jgi:hypothetical protein